MGIDFGDFFNATRFQQWRGETLFDRKNAARFGLQADCGGAEFDGFYGVFYLEEAAFGGEGVNSSVVFGSGQIHDAFVARIFLVSVGFARLLTRVACLLFGSLPAALSPLASFSFGFIEHDMLKLKLLNLRATNTLPYYS